MKTIVIKGTGRHELWTTKVRPPEDRADKEPCTTCGGVAKVTCPACEGMGGQTCKRYKEAGYTPKKVK